MKAMNMKIRIASAAILVFGYSTMLNAQSSEFDDMYFNSKDRVQAVKPLSASTVNNQFQSTESTEAESNDSQQAYQAYKNNTYDNGSYSAKEVNPEFIDKYKNGQGESFGQNSQGYDNPTYNNQDYYAEDYNSEKYTRDEGQTVINNNYYNGYVGGSRYNSFYNDPWSSNRWGSAFNIGYNPGYGWNSAVNIGFGSGFYSRPFYGGYNNSFYDPFNSYASFYDPFYGGGHAYRPFGYNSFYGGNRFSNQYYGYSGGGYYANNGIDNVQRGGRTVVRGGRDLRGSSVRTGTSRSSVTSRPSTTSTAGGGRYVTNNTNNTNNTVVNSPTNGRTRNLSTQNEYVNSSGNSYRATSRSVVKRVEPIENTRRSIRSSNTGNNYSQSNATSTRRYQQQQPQSNGYRTTTNTRTISGGGNNSGSSSSRRYNTTTPRSTYSNPSRSNSGSRSYSSGSSSSSGSSYRSSSSGSSSSTPSRSSSSSSGSSGTSRSRR
jgi:hypothetical protein